MRRFSGRAETRLCGALQAKARTWHLFCVMKGRFSVEGSEQGNDIITLSFKRFTLPVLGKTGRRGTGVKTERPLRVNER